MSLTVGGSVLFLISAEKILAGLELLGYRVLLEGFSVSVVNLKDWNSDFSPILDVAFKCLALHDLFTTESTVENSFLWRWPGRSTIFDISLGEHLGE